MRSHTTAPRRLVRAVLLLSFFATAWAVRPSQAQPIDFEQLPDGSPTAEGQLISDQYLPYGVTFSLLDRTTGAPVGYPRIAKVGAPRTAFIGCKDQDLPYEGHGIGQSFLTDGSDLTLAGNILVTYSPPVSRTSGVVLDVDCFTNGQPPCEQWTIEARDSSGTTVATQVISAEPGASNPVCIEKAGPGDAKVFGWSFELPGQLISSILFRYTGAKPTNSVGLGFDNFRAGVAAGSPEVRVAGPDSVLCAGQQVELLAEATGGMPPFSYLWQEETAPGVWTDAGTERSLIAAPPETRNFRVRVTDTVDAEGTSLPFPLTVVTDPGHPACAVRLLASSYYNDQVLRYNPVSITYVDIFASAGADDLDGANGLDFGRDGDLRVASNLNNHVERYDGASGAFEGVFVDTAGGLGGPTDLIYGPDGNLYAASRSKNSVRRFDGLTGALIGDFVPPGSGGLTEPTGLVFGPLGDLFVSSRNTNSIKRYEGASGAYLGDFVAAGAGGLSYPRGLVFGPDGNLYVGGETTNDVQRFNGVTGTPMGRFVAAADATLNRANHLLFGREGNLFVTSFDNSKVIVFGGRTGRHIATFPTAGVPLNGSAFLRFTRYCGDGLCEGGEDPCLCPEDCGAPPVNEIHCADGADDDCDGSPDCADLDCAASPPCGVAGAVPDGAAVPGTPLLVSRLEGDLILSWGLSCLSTDSDYEIYEGNLAAPDSHAPRFCSTGGTLNWTITPYTGNRYYLVVPRNAAKEGSYGLRSDGSRRPAAGFPCLPQAAGPCP